MCGIFAYTGSKNAREILIDGLSSLEYRGYDSAGIYIPASGAIKAAGPVSNLKGKVPEEFPGTSGIAHLRWATHGAPTERNAHPHRDCAGKVWVVHNGIVENFAELKESLSKLGHAFASDTDTEVVAHLIEEHLKRERDFEKAAFRALNEIRGTYGILLQHAENPELIIAARMGAPVVIGLGNGENFAASDPSPILRHARAMIFLEDGEVALLRPDRHEIKKLDATRISRTPQEIDWNVEEAQKGGYEHFMLKEIMEGPDVIRNTIRGRLIAAEGRAKLGGLESAADEIREAERIVIVGCGTAYYSGLVGEYMIEEFAGIYNHAGPEIGVASTKAFVSQLTAFALLTLFLGRQRNLSIAEGQKIAQAIEGLPDQIETILERRPLIEAMAKKYSHARDFLYIGRKYNYPIAFESALKLKEISYIHAEGCGAGEMKHGPLAMIDENFPTLAIAPSDSVYEKIVSNIQEIKARSGPVIALATDGNEKIKELADDVLHVPQTIEMLQPILNIIPLQLFAYYFATHKNLTVDRPRNLAKSVTVE